MHSIVVRDANSSICFGATSTTRCRSASSASGARRASVRRLASPTRRPGRQRLGSGWDAHVLRLPEQVEHHGRHIAGLSVDPCQAMTYRKHPTHPRPHRLRRIQKPLKTISHNTPPKRRRTNTQVYKLHNTQLPEKIPSRPPPPPFPQRLSIRAWPPSRIGS